MTKPSWLTTWLVSLAWLILGSLGSDYEVDFQNGNHCSRYHIGPDFVSSADKIIALARPRHTNFPGSISCVLRFQARDLNSGLRLFTRDFEVSDCGVKLEVYDQNRNFLNPRWELTCDTPANQVYTIDSGMMTLRLSKASSVAYGYRFEMQITTADSPRKEYPQEVYRPAIQRSSLSEGAIIGISISCVVGGIVLIAIIIFVVYKRRSVRRSQREPRTAYQEQNYTKGPPLSQNPHFR